MTYDNWKTRNRDDEQMERSRDPTKERSERFNHAVRAACCDACDYPACGCETTAEVLRKGINAWEQMKE